MKHRMLRGDLYRPDDAELVADRSSAQALLERYNRTRHDETQERHSLLRELLGSVGDDVIVKPTFRCDYGEPISVGARTSINYGCTMLDVAPIRIGSDCRFGPGVQLLAATHPIDPGPRKAGWERGGPISIHDNVWLGGRVIVCPGVAIGENTVIGAGSVVTRDLPAGVVAFGTPATVQREISDRDRIEVPPLETASHPTADDLAGRGDSRKKVSRDFYG